MTDAGPDLTDWSAYRKCSRVCRAPAGKPCTSVYSTIEDGRPAGPPAVLLFPHRLRPRRTGRGVG